MNSSSPQPSPHLLGLVVAPLFAGLMFVFLPDTLSDSARTLAAILTWVVVMWITEPIPPAHYGPIRLWLVCVDWRGWDEIGFCGLLASHHFFVYWELFYLGGLNRTWSGSTFWQLASFSGMGGQ